MADSVATKVLYEDDNWYIASFTNVSDGTGESAVQKVDISALTPAPKMKVSIMKVWYCCSGMSVSILFDAGTDDRMLVLQGDGCMDFSEFGGVIDPRSSTPVGDILFTTTGHTSGDTYTVILKLRKH
jgi:hypothetical protein